MPDDNFDYNDMLPSGLSMRLITNIENPSISIGPYGEIYKSKNDYIQLAERLIEEGYFGGNEDAEELVRDEIRKHK
ncbi:MAG: hypothetical protein JSV63_02155 [Candidatus Aenigmatarchaeota archaeon]|nr:MAG: hypothetical protein JSV63_02155 [Candidatus Aenigmarchaeota archaeon]